MKNRTHEYWLKEIGGSLLISEGTNFRARNVIMAEEANNSVKEYTAIHNVNP